jgi:hypothetical protein
MSRVGAMMKSKKTLAVVFAGTAALALVAANMVAFQGTAIAAAGQGAAVTEAAAEPAEAEATRGDLLVPIECLNQVWPDISPECLIGDDGATSAEVRTVTIGYETGEDSSVLMRMPARELASN